jgi:integrase/recombinase XerD
MSSSTLKRAMTRYLAHKRALGYRYRHEGWLLGVVHRHCRQHGGTDLDPVAYERWSRSIKHRHSNTRRKWQQIVRNFCLYRRRRDPQCFVPSADGFAKPQPYVTPVIVEPEQVARLLTRASRLKPTATSPLQGPCMRLALVLLYTCGLRLGELLRLTLEDVEQDGAVLRIRESKFHKSRLVPLSGSTATELQTFLLARRAVFDDYPNAPLLCNRHGGHLHGYHQPGMQSALRRLFVAADIRDQSGRLPRTHDLRHSFAVQALIRWYQQGADVQTNLPKLALYMGHVSIESSAYYLHSVPLVRALASERFERRFGQLVAGGAS